MSTTVEQLQRTHAQIQHYLQRYAVKLGPRADAEALQFDYLASLAVIQSYVQSVADLIDTDTPAITPADLALLAAHVGVRQDGQPATYADALAYLTLHSPRQRAALVADLWRRYGPQEGR